MSPTTRYAHNALGQRVFKTEPLYPPGPGDEADPGFMQSLIAFFTKLWSPSTTQAEQLGYAYVYDEQGTLIAEAGSGGANSAGQASYFYLPTANGPMPIAAVINGATYAVHSDHLNTPRKLTDANGQAVWQWSYSAFGEDKPTLAKNRFANLDTTPNPGTTNISEVKFNLRYPGQYADEESGLFYNYFRSYDAKTGRYSQPDPIGLRGGWNRFGYVDANPLKNTDLYGLQAYPDERPTRPIGIFDPVGDAQRELARRFTRAIKNWTPFAPTDSDPWEGGDSSGDNYEKCMAKCSMRKAAGIQMCQSLYGPNGQIPSDDELVRCVGGYVDDWLACRVRCQQCP